MSRLRTRSRRVTDAVIVGNVTGASASAVFAVVGVVRPGYVQPSSSASSLAQFWSASSAVRTLAITGVLLAGVARGRRPAPQLLVAAGITQLGDAGLGLWQCNPPMAVLPAVMGLVHLSSARFLASTQE